MIVAIPLLIPVSQHSRFAHFIARVGRLQSRIGSRMRMLFDSRVARRSSPKPNALAPTFRFRSWALTGCVGLGSFCIRDLRRETTSSFLGGTSSTGAQEAIDSAQQPRSERRAGERRGRLMARGRCRFASQSARAVAPRRSTPKSGKRRRGWRKARKAPNPYAVDFVGLRYLNPRRSPRLAIFSRTLSARDCCSSELAQRPSRRRNKAPSQSRHVSNAQGRGASGLMIDVEMGIARPTRFQL